MASFVVVLTYTNDDQPNPAPEAHRIAKGEERKYDLVSLKYKYNHTVIIHVLIEDDHDTWKMKPQDAIDGAAEWADFMLNETRYIPRD